MQEQLLIAPGALGAAAGAVIVDCRFALADPQEGRRLYAAGHVPGAHYLDLNRDLSAPPGEHGGRHPLPPPDVFAATLAAIGIAADTDVIVYDDSRFAFAARLWWMLRSLGYRPPRLLDGGYSAFIAGGGEPQQAIPPAVPCAPARVSAYNGCLDIDGVRRAQAGGAMLVDSREARRYEGLEEPIDPVAGHIPGALNLPWQGVTDDKGCLLDAALQRQRWGKLAAVDELVVYCGSGVTACVNLLSLAQIGRADAQLYVGSWSDWCSYEQ
ncbi:MAG: sulfurtransferase [Halioglobus sp.]|nr:sulfurtransferase [Halioglobus sp.]